ncbi:hypothetical protein [Mucilaginibacter glaciei]|uniref:Uncharacterized protein n=1 Tax=Mucilaginibacter glaciei TaxID=2772109 RepID=A0A926S0K4_9SPHI|nr:hypothetical protein [Mucilaginibacter glaciei]MBD1393055.1 hypothetical protein [Mucilaginibacter glaciei]
MESMENANAEGHYKFLVLTIVAGLVGVYLRFAEFPHATLVSNLVLLVASFVALKAVFGILK